LITNPEFKISLPELQIVLNKFDDEINISYPPISDIHFLKAIPSENGYDLKINKKGLEFNTKLPNEIKKEIPDITDLRECLLASKCLIYPNLNKFEDKYINHYQEMNRKVFISPDSNILYHKYISNSNIKFDKIIIAATVQHEITTALNYKYNRKLIDDLKSSFDSYKYYFDELFNRKNKKSRKAAYLALSEFNTINKIITEQILPNNLTNINYEQYDNYIIRELKDYEIKSQTLILFLTSDNAITDICKAYNLEYFLFELPEISNIPNCSYQNFINLIFNLSTVFGFIKLNSVIIFGEFSKKINPFELKIKLLNVTIKDELEKDLIICKKLINTLHFDF